jgi:Serine incorporator (Serinc)
LLDLQLFFSFMALVLLGVKYKSDKRDQYLHHGNWMVKLGLWLLFSALPFFFPNGLINIYGAHSMRVCRKRYPVGNLVCDASKSNVSTWLSIGAQMQR